MCKICDTAWCKRDCKCYGCRLRAKNLNIAGETVAGHTFGQPFYKPLTDTAEDQGVVAGLAWEKISHEMQAGGYVAQDKLQQACEIQITRANEAAAAVGVPVKKTN